MTSDNKNRPAMSHFATMDDYREALAKHEAATAEQSSTPVPPAGGDTKCPRGCTGPDEGGSGCAAVTGECSMSAPAVPEGVDTAELRALLTEWHAGYQYGPATRFDRAQKSIIGLLAQQREAGRREGWTDGGQILQAAGKIEAALATRCDQGLATRQPDLPPDFLMPEDAWNEYAIRSGLLNECGVAPDPAKTQTAYFAYQAAWNRLHAAFSAYIATRQPVSQTDHDLLKLTLEQTQELLRQADEAIAKRDATALRVATCAGEFARDAARCQPVSAPDDNDRLKSCPHCGGHAEIDQSESGGYYIECLVCGASTQLIFATGDDPVPLLMERWNKRIRPAEPVSALTDERTAFESWARSSFLMRDEDLRQTEDGYYSVERLSSAWRAWQDRAEIGRGETKAKELDARYRTGYSDGWCDSLALLAASPKAEPVPEWRCFHCNDAFTDADQAALHFGTSERQGPACQIDVARFREMEARVTECAEEDSDLHRTMYAMQSKHATDLLREEEKGYVRALRDTGYVVQVSDDKRDSVELDRIKRLAACGTVDSFLALPEQDKRYWFAMAWQESDLRKKAEERLAFLHSTNKDVDGYEYGVCKVRHDAAGHIESFLWCISDHSDVDAAIAATTPQHQPEKKK